MTIDDLKPSISQLSRDEAFSIHERIRANRLISKRKPSRSTTKTRSPKAIVAGLGKDEAAELLKLLEGE